MLRSLTSSESNASLPVPIHAPTPNSFGIETADLSSIMVSLTWVDRKRRARTEGTNARHIFPTQARSCQAQFVKKSGKTQNGEAANYFILTYLPEERDHAKRVLKVSAAYPRSEERRVGK